MRRRHDAPETTGPGSGGVRGATPWRWPLLAACAALPLLLGACCWGAWQVAASTITVWDIPADFRGYAVLEWANPECPELPRRGLTRVIPIDATGYACTASRPGDVPSGQRTYLVWPDGHREELPWRGHPDAGLQPYSGFTAYHGDGSAHFSANFIGTAEGYRAHHAAPYPPACATPGRLRSACIR